jgi:hypothetical protein
MNELIQRVAIAVQSGAVPRPIPGESYDDLRFRTAHAGALIGFAYAQELEAAHQAEQFAAERVTSPDSATVTSLPTRDDDAV